MTIEDRIRMTMHEKVRVVITGRKRSATGFDIRGADGTNTHAPSKREALQILLAVVRCQPRRQFEIRPAKVRTA